MEFTVRLYWLCFCQWWKFDDESVTTLKVSQPHTAARAIASLLSMPSPVLRQAAMLRGTVLKQEKELGEGQEPMAQTAAAAFGVKGGGASTGKGGARAEREPCAHSAIPCVVWSFTVGLCDYFWKMAAAVAVRRVKSRSWGRRPRAAWRRSW
jgi:hypothetical protein